MIACTRMPLFRRTPLSTKGRVLAIDHGEVRLGLALSDELGMIASGVGTIPNNDDTLRVIVGMVAERDVRRVVVGLPLQLSGDEGDSARRARAFADALRQQLAIPIDLVDERFTSSLATQAIRDMGVGRKKRREKAKVDEIAAIILLQGVLDSGR